MMPAQMTAHPDKNSLGDGQEAEANCNHQCRHQQKRTTPTQPIGQQGERKCKEQTGEMKAGQGAVCRARLPTLIAQIEWQVPKRSLNRAADAKHRHRQQPNVAQTADAQQGVAQGKSLRWRCGLPVC